MFENDTAQMKDEEDSWCKFVQRESTTLACHMHINHLQVGEWQRYSPTN